MDFYVVKQSPKGELERYRTDFFYDDSVRTSDATKCTQCGNFVSMLPALPPFVVHLETWGDDFGDVAFGASDVLVSAHFKDAYQFSNLNGLSQFESVSIASHKNYGAKPGTTPKYSRASPRKNATQIDVKASDVEWEKGREPTCNVCLGGIIRRWRRIIVDESTWNGDDIFYAYGIPGVLIVSKRFVEWSRPYGFRNLIFEPAIESGHDFYPWEATS